MKAPEDYDVIRETVELKKELDEQPRYLEVIHEVMLAMCDIALEPENQDPDKVYTAAETAELRRRVITVPFAKFNINLPEEHLDRLFERVVGGAATNGIASCEAWDLAHGLQHAVEMSLGKYQTHH